MLLTKRVTLNNKSAAKQHRGGIAGEDGVGKFYNVFIKSPQDNTYSFISC
jgi:hypothetical protein